MDESQPLSTHSKIARNVSVMSLSVGLTMVIGLALRMILPRLMGPEKMGIFYFADSFTNMFFAFLPLGLTTYINRTIPSNHRHAQEIFGTILVVEFIMAALIGGAMLATLVYTKKSMETITCTVFMGFYAAIFHFQRNILQKIFMSIDHMGLISMVNVVVKILLVVGCLLLLKIQPSVVWIAAVYAASEFLGLIYLLYKSFQHRFFDSKPSLDRFKAIMKVSLPFYLAGVLTTAFTEMDVNMLAQFSNNTEVGYFGAAYKLTGVFMLLVPILQNSFTPSLSQAWSKQNGEFPILVKQLINFLLVCSLPLSVVLLLFGDYLARALYGVGFEPSYKILCFLTPVLTMVYLNTFTAISVHLTSTGGRISQIFVLGILINVILDYLLIPYGMKFGPGGAGVAVSFCTFLCEIYTFLAMLRIFPCKILDFKLIKNFFVILAPCWLAMIFYDSMVALNFWQRLGLAFATPFYGLLTRLVTMGELKMFMQLTRRTLRRG